MGGEPQSRPFRMKMGLVTPCARCPFRHDVRPYITAARAIEIVESLTDGDQTFACHKTTRFEEDDDGFCAAVRHPDEQHCAGAMIMLEKMERPNQWMRIAERLRIYDRHRLRMDAPVYDDGDAMIEAHEDEESGRPQCPRI